VPVYRHGAGQLGCNRKESFSKEQCYGAAIAGEVTIPTRNQLVL